MGRMADVRGPGRPRREPSDGHDPAALGQFLEERLGGLHLAPVGRRFEVSVPGWVGTTFQQSASSSSSASVRRTIVALASAGPAPVSWRSDVKGIPDMRAPR